MAQRKSTRGKKARGLLDITVDSDQLQRSLSGMRYASDELTCLLHELMHTLQCDHGLAPRQALLVLLASMRQVEARCTAHNLRAVGLPGSAAQLSAAIDYLINALEVREAVERSGVEA